MSGTSRTSGFVSGVSDFEDSRKASTTIGRWITQEDDEEEEDHEFRISATTTTNEEITDSTDRDDHGGSTSLSSPHDTLVLGQKVTLENRPHNVMVDDDEY